MSEGATAALTALDKVAALRTTNRAEYTRLMARLSAAVVAADRAGVDRSTIIARSGLSRRTVYKILGGEEHRR